MFSLIKLSSGEASDRIKRQGRAAAFGGGDAYKAFWLGERVGKGKRLLCTAPLAPGAVIW